MSVFDNIKDFFALKAKPARDVEESDEYILPALNKGEFKMTEALWRRNQYEELCKRYGIAPNKDGSMI